MDRYYRLLKQHWLNILTFLYIFFIIYSTVVPFNFILNSEFIPYRLHKIQWIPFKGGITGLNRSDIVANMIFFIPLGVLFTLRIILSEYRNLRIKEWLKVIISGAIVSISVEVLQIFTFDRQTSFTDIIMNSLGTLVGAVLILVLYLKFHKEIKKVLFTLFVNKPEMIIAGLFLGFIVVSSLAPFTFRVSLHIVKKQFIELISGSFSTINPIGDFLAYLLLFSTFIYFLISGIERYFSDYLQKIYYTILVLWLFLIPIFCELFQLLLPIRHHSIADAVLSQMAILVSLIYYYFSKRRRQLDSISNYYEKRHTRFFYFLTLIYSIYIIHRMMFSSGTETSLSILKTLVDQTSFSHNKLSGFNRLNLLILISKELFAFLPAGFILTLIWFRTLKTWQRRISLLISAVAIPVVYYSAGSLLNGFKYSLLDISAASLGIGFGYVCWHIYKFMIDKIII